MNVPRSREPQISSAQVQHRLMADQSVDMPPDPVIERYKRDLDVTLITSLGAIDLLGEIA